MKVTPAQRHQRREAKAARRRKRLNEESPRQFRRRQEALMARKGEGVERLEQAFANAPKGFGKAKPKAKAEQPEQEGRVAA